MPHGTTGNELAYYHRTTFKDVKPVTELNLPLIKERNTKAIFERHHYYPTDYFCFSYEDKTYFGRKTLSQLFLNGKQPYKKCNQLHAPMIIGLVLRSQVTEKGIIFFYKPLANNEKAFLFNQLKENPHIDIYFPFPVLEKSLHEHVQPLDAWDPTDEMADELNTGEEHIRSYTLQLLAKYDMKDKVVYDPACSTGKFLGTIKKQFPQAITIGQDINAEMIKYAKLHSPIDKLVAGDANNPCIENGTADFIFVRFLNLSVLSSETALKLFIKLAQCCKQDGKMIVFGFTPVLLSAEIFEILNFKIEQKTAYSQENDAVFQYYVLKKHGPVPQLRYENFSALKITPSELFKPAAVKQPANEELEIKLQSKL